MNKYAKRTALAVLAVSAGFAAHRSYNKELCTGFLPENDMKIELGGDVHAYTIQEAMFNRVLDRVEQVYGPIVASKGGRLVVNRRWSDGTVNASANQSGGNWYLNMYGGLARHAATTEEGFMLVACHELGHHIGGYPKMSWATNEGGADYFATLKCMRNMYGGAAPQGNVDAVAEQACQSQFADEPTRNSCRNGARGGQSVAFLFQALRNSPKPPEFGTPDQSRTDRMNNAHPDTQCRLDTYFQGALCTASLGTDVSNSDPNAGSCTKKNGQQIGLRSRCWYKPPADEPALDSAPMAMKRLELKTPEAVGSRIEALRDVLLGRGV
ncbi:MAG: hypothetical protein FD126_348 [Elusimicrobia bacterium]|nr:MAG: hypothetical protein FD126_348 [Elusimicrobiota bacterium]